MLAVLKRFPLAANLPGHLHEEVFDPVFLASAPIVRVPTYGRRSSGRAPARGSAADEDALERLRALGYIK